MHKINILIHQPICVNQYFSIKKFFNAYSFNDNQTKKGLHLSLFLQVFLRKYLETKYVYDFGSTLLLICVDNTSEKTEN